MPKHTEAEMEQLSLEELKQGAIEEASSNLFNAANVLNGVAQNKAEPVKDEEPESFERITTRDDGSVITTRTIYQEDGTVRVERVIDARDGSGPQVSHAEAPTREEALDILLSDKEADAHLHASRKIRQQNIREKELEAKLKEFEAKEAAKQKPAELSEDDEYVIGQKLQKSPGKTIQEQAEAAAERVLERREAERRAKEASAQQIEIAKNDFIASHPDLEEDGVEGEKNGELLSGVLAKHGLPLTSENLHKAYLHLKQRGFLTLKTREEANVDATKETADTSRIEKPAVEVAQTRTKKTSGISTHSRSAVVPLNTEPSEDELYKMPMDKLRELANKQLAAR